MEIPYILSLAYKSQIDIACEKLDSLGLQHFAMYIIFNDGTRFILSNVYQMLVPYYVEEFYKEDFSISPEIIDENDYYLCDRAGSVSAKFKDALEERFDIHRVYYIVRKCTECTFVFGAIKNKKFYEHEKFYKNTIFDFEDFCCYFSEQLMDVIKLCNPGFKNSFILTNNQLLRAVIKRGYPKEEYLTDREKECLWLASKGKSTKEVAKILGVSPATAETHNKNIREKLNCSTLIEAVVEGIHRGFIGKINKKEENRIILNNGRLKIASNIAFSNEKIKNTNLWLLNNM